VTRLRVSYSGPLPVLLAGLAAVAPVPSCSVSRITRNSPPHGLHTCVGAHINQVLIPAILKLLLRQPGLRRAAGPVGQIGTTNTTFPVHLCLEYHPNPAA